MLFLSMLLIPSPTHAQSTTRQFIVLIEGIEYDDPDFTALKNVISKNPKVKSFRPSYTSGTATLSFTYPGESSQLWEDIPKTIKTHFKVTELKESSISLSRATAQKNTIASANNKQKNCFDCEYFPMCNYDVEKSYGGKVYHGMRNDKDGVVYYNCEDGVVTMKWETSSQKTYTAADYDPFFDIATVVVYNGDKETTTHTQVLLKANALLNTEWESEGSIKRKIIANDISMMVNGIKYNNVLVVCRAEGHKYSYTYYARNTGNILTENGLDPGTKLYQLKRIQGLLSSGKKDKELVGNWKYLDRFTDKYFIYIFKDDGTYEYYKNQNSETTIQKPDAETGWWTFKGDTLILSSGTSRVQYFLLKKINNTSTGKPGITLEPYIAAAGIFDKRSVLEYQTMDNNKKPWNDIPGFGN